MNSRGMMLAAALAVGTAVFGGDAERNDSAAMNPSAYRAERSVEGGVKVLFLGNSITLHGPAAGIGWTNCWGMAASSAERDYAHIVTRGIEKELGRKADVRIRNIADFERGWQTWKPAEQLAGDLAFKPDYLIVAIGENTSDHDLNGFGAAFERVLAAFCGPDGKIVPKTVVRGVFWPNAAKDAVLSAAAGKVGAKFVRTDFRDEPGMIAGTKLFSHPGVAAHPGDAGMARTASCILTAFFPKADALPAAEKPVR